MLIIYVINANFLICD